MEIDPLFHCTKLSPSLRVIEQMCHIYPGKILLSYNGGKDCTVILDMIEKLNVHVPVVYFTETDAFEELESFVKNKLENLSLPVIYKRENIREELQGLVEEGYRAIFLGQREGDPGVSWTVISVGSPHWPNILRVFPVVNWDYGDIWKYIKSYNVEYCPLYDKGYSSLGAKAFTRPNPSLQGKPAWLLTDFSSERVGRCPRL